MRSGFKHIGLFNLAAIAAAMAWGKPTRPNMENLEIDPAIVNALRGLDQGDAHSSKYAPRYSRYLPHQGLQECARRRRQMAKIAAKGD